MVHIDADRIGVRIIEPCSICHRRRRVSSDSLPGQALDPAAPDDRYAGAALSDLGQLWFVPVFFGVVSVVFGALVVAWPDVTIKVIAVLFGIHLII